MSSSSHPPHRVSVRPFAPIAAAGGRARQLSATQIARAAESDGEWADLVAAFRAGAVQIDLAGLAEADAAYIPEAFACGMCPDRFPARLTALLYERYVAVHGDAHRGVTFVASAWYDQHADDLHHGVLEHAQNWALPGAFAQWITTSAGLVSTDTLVGSKSSREAG